MTGAPALSLFLAASGLQTALVVVLAILGALVVLALLGGLVLFLRRGRPDESAATVESTAPPRPVPGSVPPGAGPGPVPGDAGDAFAPRPPVAPPANGPPPSAPPPAVPEGVSSPQQAPAAPGVQNPGAATPAPPSPPAGQGPEAVPPQPQPPPAEVEAPVTADSGPLAAPPQGVQGPAGVDHPRAPISPTQTPDDVDQRSPAELAAAAQAAAAAEAHEAAGNNGSGPSGAIQHEGAIGPPRPVPVAKPVPPDPARLRLLGLTLGILTERMRREHPPQLGTALARLVDSDQEAARSQLATLALSLLGEEEEPSAGDGQLSLFLQEALEGEARRGFSFSSMPEFQQALNAVAPELREKLQTIVWARNPDSVTVLTTEDVEALERVAVAMATALMIDTSYDVRRLPDEAAPGRT